jgi:hypothetical protein
MQIYLKRRYIAVYRIGANILKKHVTQLEWYQIFAQINLLFGLDNSLSCIDNETYEKNYAFNNSLQRFVQQELTLPEGGLIY